MSKNKKLKICDANIHPGEKANLAMPLPERYSCSPLYMPINVINGKNKGPCIVVFSLLKGNEFNGLEIANRIFRELKPEKVSGSIITIPVVNVYGLTHLGDNDHNMANLADYFPGSEDGSFEERLANQFTKEILSKADYCIELQTGGPNHNILPQIYCCYKNTEARKLAKAFQSPVITDVDIKDNKLRQTTEEMNIPLLVYQAGEAMRFDENAIDLGVEGVKNVMRTLDILPRAPEQDIKPIFSTDEEWIVSHKAGILNTHVTLGQKITKNDLMGTIADPFGLNSNEKIHAYREGIVVGINTTPLIHEGSEIFKIASFTDDEKAENLIEKWDKKQPDSYVAS